MNIKKSIIALLLPVLILVLFSGCNNEPVLPANEADITIPDESFLKYGDKNEAIVELNRINDRVWVHTSYLEKESVLIPSNGLVVLTEKSLVLIDTAWTEKQMESLNKLVKEAFNIDIKEAIITHANLDKMSGISYLNNNDIKVSALEKVVSTAKLGDLTLLWNVFEEECANIEIDGADFELYFPGKGYTQDNTVVWIDDKKILFAGCLVTEYGAETLATMPDSDIKCWPEAISALQERYTDVEIVVPGNGQWGGFKLLDYTMTLLEEKGLCE